MIKIITAIGNPHLNNELKRYEEFDVVGNDILYPEGIIELLENDSEINYIIMGEDYNNTGELISKIKEINNKIIIINIIDRKNSLNKNNLYKEGITEIFYEDENIEKIITYLKTKNIEYLNKELRNEIDNLKKIIMNNKKEKNNIKKNICIGITGASGIGTTTSCVLFAEALKKKNKILLIDFNIKNSQIGIIYNKKINYSKIDENNYKDLIINIKKNLDILIGLDVLNDYKKINFNYIKNIIKECKNKYDYIFVDTSINQEIVDNKYVFYCFDYIFILSGINVLEDHKNKKITQTIIEKWNIPKKKIRRVFYRINFIELIKIIVKKEQVDDIKKIGIITNNIFIKNSFNNDKKIINKLLINKIIKNI